MREAGVHGPGLIGAIEHFIEALIDHQRQALAAELGVTGQRGPAGVDVLAIGFLETFGCLHGVGHRVIGAALGVTADIEREDDFGSKFAAFLQHGIDGFSIHVSVLRNLLEVIRYF